jgi:site-specific recombinase XerD
MLRMARIVLALRLKTTLHQQKAISLSFTRGDKKPARFTFHALCHIFASWLVENGTNIYHVQELLGHSDLNLTARYAHIGENSLRAAVLNLETTPVASLLKTESD